MAEEAPATVGETVRKLRRWRGKDQETLAGLVGRSQAWLSNVESGKTRLDRRTDIESVGRCAPGAPARHHRQAVPHRRQADVRDRGPDTGNQSGALRRAGRSGPAVGRAGSAGRARVGSDVARWGLDRTRGVLARACSVVSDWLG